MAEPVKTIAKNELRPASIDPDRDAATYLAAKGWKLYDGDPKREGSRWLDPTKPEQDVESKVKVGVKKLPGNKGVEDILQTRILPAAWPLYRDAAVRVQMERDEAEKK